MATKVKKKELTPINTSLGVILIVALIVAGSVGFLYSPLARAESIPPRANEYLPVLVNEYRNYWPEFAWPEKLAGQVEQETCAKPTSPKCWNPRTENINPKNNGEYGWGLGQLTNTNRYNNFKEVTTKYEGLKTWKWEDRFNPEMQLRTLIYMDKACARPYTKATPENQAKFAWSCYNGGQGSVLNDRKYCSQIEGCDPEVWDGNVETHSLKPRSKLGGYSVSAYSINREYVANIWGRRGAKYKVHVDSILQSLKAE